MTMPRKIPVDGEIDSVARALEIAVEFSGQEIWNWPSDKEMPVYEPPFGIWYRGQCSMHSLIPSVFREYGKKRDKRLINETNLFLHFVLRSPKYRKDHPTPFEWLCLMQHYGAPTRLLDWSESVLVALYFAVSGNTSKDGELYVLNAAYLNAFSDVPRPARRPSIHTPDNYNVVLRASMARSLDVHAALQAADEQGSNYYDHASVDMKALLAFVKDDSRLQKFDTCNEPSFNEFIERMKRPVAVFPYRTNERLLTQQGMFTLHGGKRYQQSRVTSRHLLPFGFEDFPRTPFLRRYQIPHSSKFRIMTELNAAGINKGSLFPELDQQSEHMTAIWLQK